MEKALVSAHVRAVRRNLLFFCQAIAEWQVEPTSLESR